MPSDPKGYQGDPKLGLVTDGVLLEHGGGDAHNVEAGILDPWPDDANLISNASSHYISAQDLLLDPGGYDVGPQHDHVHDAGATLDVLMDPRTVGAHSVPYMILEDDDLKLLFLTSNLML